jgi:hypothetical protein
MVTAPKAHRAPAPVLRRGATITDLTPGTARTAASARSRTASHAFTALASTVIDKNTFPSLATISDSFPVAGRAVPSGLETLPRAARTSCLRSVMPTYIGPLRRWRKRLTAALTGPVDGAAPEGP